MKNASTSTRLIGIYIMDELDKDLTQPTTLPSLIVGGVNYRLFRFFPQEKYFGKFFS